MKSIYVVYSTDSYSSFMSIKAFETEKDATAFALECRRWQDTLKRDIDSGNYAIWCEGHPAGEARNEEYCIVQLPYMEAK